MPELPEVEVVRRGLDPHVTGAIIESAEVLHPRVTRRNTGNFVHQVSGARISHISRRGKYLWFVLDQPHAIVAHLGMSGQFRINQIDPPGNGFNPHTRLTMWLRSAGAPVQLAFVDQRTFGGLHVSPCSDVGSGEVLPESVRHIARDPLDPLFDPDLYVQRALSKSVAIKRVLLDQTLMSGVGNIYADEALFRAGVHGDIRADSLSATAMHELVSEVTTVMNEALEEGGTSFDALYVHVNGESGYFSRSLAVYGREGQPCDRCGQPISRTQFMNRSSYFCAVCQPLSRAVASQ